MDPQRTVARGCSRRHLTTVSKHPRIFVEAYVETVAQALNAVGEGADRLELCGPGEGGLTPSVEMLGQVAGMVSVPIHAMLRPRTGGFVYDADEFRRMQRGLPSLKQHGAAGVVLGILLDNARLDVPRMRALIAAADGLRVVCHRAFDATPDADEALEQLATLGVHEVLTSGHAPSALEGAATLRRHVERARGRLEILAGGGVRPHNVQALLTQTGVHRVHARAFDAGVIAGIRAAVSG